MPKTGEDGYTRRSRTGRNYTERARIEDEIEAYAKNKAQAEQSGDLTEKVLAAIGPSPSRMAKAHNKNYPPGSKWDSGRRDP